MLLVALSAALAKPARKPELLTVHREGSALEITRMEVEVEVEKDPDPPTSADPNAYDAYEAKMDDLTDRRADLKAVDALVRREASALAACALAAGAVPGAEATARISYTREGKGSVRLAKGADAALGGCLVSQLHKQRRPVLVHAASTDPAADWRFVLAAPPEGTTLAAGALIDRSAGFGPVDFGEPAEALDDRRMASSYRNTVTYSRGFDGDAMLGGAKGGPAWSFDAKQGLYAARFMVTSDSAAFSVKESLKEMFGAPRWDSALSAWYWRGEHVVWVAEQAGDATMITVLDIDRARAAGLVETAPGDPREMNSEAGSRLPRVLGDGQ